MKWYWMAGAAFVAGTAFAHAAKAEAEAYYNSAVELEKTCRSKRNSYRSECYGYLMGTFHGIRTAEQIANHKTVCPNGKINGIVLKAVFLSYMHNRSAEHKAKYNQFSNEAANVAFAQAWPCK